MHGNLLNELAACCFSASTPLIMHMISLNTEVEFIKQSNTFFRIDNCDITIQFNSSSICVLHRIIEKLSQ